MKKAELIELLKECFPIVENHVYEKCEHNCALLGYDLSDKTNVLYAKLSKALKVKPEYPLLAKLD